MLLHLRRESLNECHVPRASAAVRAGTSRPTSASGVASARHRQATPAALQIPAMHGNQRRHARNGRHRLREQPRLEVVRKRIHPAEQRRPQRLPTHDNLRRTGGLLLRSGVLCLLHRRRTRRPIRRWPAHPRRSRIRVPVRSARRLQPKTRSVPARYAPSRRRRLHRRLIRLRMPPSIDGCERRLRHRSPGGLSTRRAAGDARCSARLAFVQRARGGTTQ